MHRKPRGIDLFFLAAFAIFITLQPYFLYGGLNYFELGIYLPNISALLDGQIPYRDFFHLRGPLELYVPAFFMHIFGENAAVLAAYFYVGTVVTLLIGIWIAKDLYRTRLVLYLMVPVFVGRTFPRVVFMNWGGLRYGLGLLALLLAIGFFRRKKSFWLVASGIISGLALLTSVEIGVCAIFSILATCVFAQYAHFHDKRVTWKFIRTYILGLALVLLPYSIYLLTTQSLLAYWDMTYAVVTNMTKVFPDYLFEDHPKNFLEAILAMSPLNRHFQHLTPAYCYLFFMAYIVYKIKRKTLNEECLPISVVVFYGLIMYIMAFRKIGAAQFEMALQPEKIILFFMLEEAYLLLRNKKEKIRKLLQRKMLNTAREFNQLKIFAINFLILGFIMSSLGYSLMRYDRRFFSFQYIKYALLGKDRKELVPLYDGNAEQMRLKRVKGMVVPSWQAQEFRQLTEFVDKNIKQGEPIFMFPELGFYSFLVDRPFVGRFPMATFSWIGGWHDEFLGDLKATKPMYAVLSKDPGPSFPRAYFKIEANKRYYDEIMQYINDYYVQVNSTPTLLIYQRKSGS